MSFGHVLIYLVKVMEQKRNVLYITHDSSVTGAPMSLLDFLVHIKNTVNVYVVAPSMGFFVEKLKEQQIPCFIIPFTSVSVPKSVTDINLKKRLELNNFKASEKVLEIVEKEKIDVIHSNTSVIDIGILTALHANIPHVWHIREFLYEDMAHEYCCSNEIKQKLFDRSCEITISSAVENAFMNRWRKKTFQVYDGIDLTRISHNINQEKRLNIIVVGTIAERKGQLEVVKAVSILAKQGLNPRLIIVGSKQGFYVDLLRLYVKQQKLEEIVFFTGETTEIQQYLCDGGIAIMPSRNEALGRVTIEYMAAGLPVIGAKSGGTIELIGEGEERGYFYKPGDSNDLAQAIIRCFNDKNVNAKILAAKEFVDETFEPQKCAKTIAKLYDEVINNFEKNVEGDILLLKEIEEYTLVKEDRSIVTNAQENLSAKYRELMNLSFRLWKASNLGFSYKEYFDAANIKSIAIYGFGEIGKNIFSECILEDVDVKFIIDRRQEVDEAEKIFGIKHLLPEDKISNVDAVIITAYGAEGIINELSKSINSEIKLINIFDESKRIIQSF